MVVFESATVLIMLGAMLLLHIGSQLARGILSKILAIVNICLHIVLLAPLLVDKVPIAEAVLCYMISVFVYVLSFFIRHVVAESGEGKR